MVKIRRKDQKDLVEKLAGFVSVPKKYYGRDIDEMIEEAKEKHFKNSEKKKRSKAI